MKTIKIALKILLSSALVFALQGCVSSSGVVKTGPDTFMISRSEKGFRGVSSKVKADAISDAEEWCQKRGKVMKVISSSQKDMVPFTSDASAEIHFKALDANDPELKKPTETGTLKNRVFRGDENIQGYYLEVQKNEEGSRTRDRYEEIAKLGESRAKNLITEEEFQVEKKKILETQK